MVWLKEGGLALVVALTYLLVAVALHFRTAALETSAGLSVVSSGSAPRVSATERALLSSALKLGLSSSTSSAANTITIRRGNQVLASGDMEVIDWLTSFANAVSRTIGGSLAAASLALSSLVLLRLPSVATWVTRIAPFGLVAAATGLATPCPLCRADGSVADVVLPLGILLYALIIGLILFTEHRFTRLVVQACCAAGGLVQSGLLYQSPKLCPFCIAAGIMLAAAVVSVPSLPRMSIAKTARNAACLGLPCVAAGVFGAGIVLNWFPGFGQKRIVGEMAFVGQSIRKVLRGTSSFRQGIYVLSKQGCEACSAAHRNLDNASLRYRTAEPCSDVGQEGCILPAVSDRLVFPTLLVVDGSDTVVDQYSGWPTTSDRSAELVLQLRPLQGNIHEKRETP